MKRKALLAFTTAVCLGHAAAAWGEGCKIGGFSPLPLNTKLALGPNLKLIIDAYPQLGTAIVAARDAWDVPNAANRLGEWTGTVSASDCPVSLPIQLGAFDFSVGGCGAVSSPGALAVVDYNATPNCPGCGTKSMAINTNQPWSFNPLPGQYDVQSTLAHEFGHMLGFWHQYQSTCGNVGGPPCAQDPNKNTMSWLPLTGETCVRDLSTWDVDNALAVYP